MPEPSPFAPVGVTRLTLTDFRCYPALRLDIDLRPVVLTGPNGAGKTNLLEAVSFLAPGRGLRRAKLSDIARHGGPAGQAWAVAAEVLGPLGECRIGTGRAAGTSDRRLVRIDGTPARSQTALGEVVSALWLTPPMDRIFQEGTSGRRRFLDRLVYGIDPAHVSRLSAFEDALRQRARLLRDGVRDPAWYAALEEQMAAHGVAVAAARRDLVARLAHRLAAADGPFPRATVAVDGTVEAWLAEHPALEVEDLYRARLAADRPREMAGMPAAGPHRSDLIVAHAGKNLPAAQCSTGEQKAVLIAILLAQAGLQGALRGAAPLLLLDEVTAHLDPERREALFAALLAFGAQAWLTGTDRSVFASLGEKAQFFDVRDAALH